MADFLTLDDLVYGFTVGGGPVPFQKAGDAMEGLGAFYHSKWYEAGVPGAGAAPSVGLNGGALTSDSTMVTGQLPFVKAAAGNTKRLAMFKATSDRAGALLLLDRLWANSSIVSTTTGAQAITAAALPARDADGATLGNGVMAYLEVSATTGNASPITNTTISYTNEAGAATRTGTISSFPATAVKGTMVPFQLQAGDRGVRSIQSITLGTNYVSGTVHLVLCRLLGDVAFSKDGGERVMTPWDELGIPKLYDGTVPFLAWCPRDTTAVNITAGMIGYAER